jgi:hypothetical protein
MANKYIIKIPPKATPLEADNWRAVDAIQNATFSTTDKVNATTTGLSAIAGKIKIDDGDSTANYLQTKLIAGAGITLTESLTGGKGSKILTAAIGAHADLTDMPDTAGDNTDHDERYRAKQQDAQPTTHADFWLDTNATFGTPFTIGDGEAGVDFELKFDGETNDGSITWMEDEDYFKIADDLLFPDNEKILFGTGADMDLYYDGTSAYLHTDLVAPSDWNIDCGTDKTIVLTETVWDDLRIIPGSFDRPGVTDPTIVVYDVNGGGVNTYLWQFQVNAIASFTIQMPHTYKQGTDIYAHVHWTAGPRGNEESGKLVGWKLDYSWANIDGTFGTMATLDLQDACAAADHTHQMSPEVVIDGHTTAKNVSSMLLCNIKRTDTGTDDTWVGTISGQLPMLLEIDFHYEIDTMGSRQAVTK